jgi:hypothetical protein
MSTRRSKLTLSILNLAGFVGTVVINGLANSLPLNNRSTGELSDQYPNLFVPAGLTFSIWGLIYLLLAVFVIYQLINAVRKNTKAVSFSERIGVFFFISSVANIGWIFAWHYEVVVLSLLIMLILLGSLISVYVRLNIGRREAANAEKFLVHLPFSIYLGWITIATIANFTAMLVHLNWNGFGLSEQFWTVLVLVVGIAITLIILFYRKDIFYSLVVDWALLGILLKRLSTDPVPVLSVIVAVIAGMSVITLGIFVQLARKKIY